MTQWIYEDENGPLILSEEVHDLMKWLGTDEGKQAVTNEIDMEILEELRKQND